MKTNRLLVVCVLSFVVTLLSCTPPRSEAQSQPSAVTTATEQGFTVVGFSVRTSGQKESGGNGVIPQMWQHVIEEGSLENIPHRADNNLTAIYTNYSADQNGEYDYVLGVRVSSVEKVPDGMISVNVPAGKYAIVVSDLGSLPEVMPKVWRRIWTMPATELGGQRSFKTDYEVYPEGFDWQNAQIPVYVGLKLP